MDDARDIVGETVLISLVDYQGLGFTGIEGEGPFFCKVDAVDEIGVWVENRHFVTMELRDSEGRDIPADEREQVESRVVFLLPWKNVRTVVKFEDLGEDYIRNEILGGDEVVPGRIGFIKQDPV